MQSKAPHKHVIFLGAGASVTSGYPLANDLRLRLSNVRQLIFDLEELAKKTFASIDFQERKVCRDYFDQFKDTLEQFRHGGFESVDAFSKLASVKYPAFVQEMKKLMWLALSLHNPELMFDKSDYYPFIQRLFSDEALPSLKRNVAVLSYNYDCYFEYLLIKAQSYRNRLGGIPEPTEALKNVLSSGFFKPSAFRDLQNTNQQFRHFKLHGSIDFADAQTHRELFDVPGTRRLVQFNTTKEQIRTPPVIFPWEIFDEKGEFIAESDFIFIKEANNINDGYRAAAQEIAVNLHRLYKQIWEGAKEAVQHADKISFVGMSMHHYLESGLRYLFQDKHTPAQVVVANPLNEYFKDERQRLHPASPSGQVTRILKSVAPKLTYHKSFSEKDSPMGDEQYARQTTGSLTARYYFKDFIEREMD